MTDMTSPNVLRVAMTGGRTRAETVYCKLFRKDIFHIRDFERTGTKYSNGVRMCRGFCYKRDEHGNLSDECNWVRFKESKAL